MKITTEQASNSPSRLSIMHTQAFRSSLLSAVLLCKLTYVPDVDVESNSLAQDYCPLRTITITDNHWRNIAINWRISCLESNNKYVPGYRVTHWISHSVVKVVSWPLRDAIKEKLNIEVDIDRAHRVERRKSGGINQHQASAKPRVFVCRLSS